MKSERQSHILYHTSGKIVHEGTPGERQDDTLRQYAQKRHVLEELDLNDAALWDLRFSGNAFRRCRFANIRMEGGGMNDVLFSNCTFISTRFNSIAVDRVRFSDCSFDETEILCEDLTKLSVGKPTAGRLILPSAANIMPGNVSRDSISLRHDGTNCLFPVTHGICNLAYRSDGYLFKLWALSTGWYVSAGCRFFSLSHAYRHWADSRAGTPLGRETFRILSMFESTAEDVNVGRTNWSTRT